MVKLYKQHSDGKIGFWQASANDEGTVTLVSAKSLDAIPVTRSYQAKPKNVGKANETTAHEQALKEIDSRASKKLDEGYCTSIETAQQGVTNRLGLKKPMLATPIEKVKPEKICWDTAYVQPKLDGHRALWCPETKTLYSRQGKPLNIPHIEETLKLSPHGEHHLDGELYCHGLPLQEISKLVKKYRPGESECIQFHVYDLVQEKPFHNRIQKLRTLGDTHHLKIVPTKAAYSYEEMMEMHKRCRDHKFEGTMLRFGGSPYQDGKRSRELLKIKEFHDAEFLIVGVMPGAEVTVGENTYKPAVWICQTNEGKEFSVLAEGDYPSKHQQFIDRHLHIGKKLTVKYHYLSKDGVPQLPIALRFREDI